MSIENMQQILQVIIISLVCLVLKISPGGWRK